ncbi:unnamed protein product [Danaus chrysippus]|uniref:(African queen) hypothetical protein n=1 Tax=Danaus chrysippus TaxID=151541 RepID=A0A8J2VU83_9NEOP|nr:unnamed protein product [Danaus chrysippus]
MVAKFCNCIEDKYKQKQKHLDKFEENNYTDLYVIGKIWIDALKICLTGADVDIFPKVEAAKAEEGPPKKPPPMKLSELSIYKSPYNDYKDYEEDKEKSPDRKVKILHQSLLPHVKNIKQEVKKNACGGLCFVKSNVNKALDTLKEIKNNFKKTMRDPDNLAIRQGVVASGGFLGFMLGSGGGITRRLLYTSAGLLTTGALCFPKETDETFRNTIYITGKSFIDIYNKWCNKDFNLRERLACRDEFPPTPPDRPPMNCPPQK